MRGLRRLIASAKGTPFLPQLITRSGQGGAIASLPGPSERYDGPVADLLHHSYCCSNYQGTWGPGCGNCRRRGDTSHASDPRRGGSKRIAAWSPKPKSTAATASRASAAISKAFTATWSSSRSAVACTTSTRPRGISTSRSSSDGQELYCQLDAGFTPTKFVFGNVAYSIGLWGRDRRSPQKPRSAEKSSNSATS